MTTRRPAEPPPIWTRVLAGLLDRRDRDAALSDLAEEFDERAGEDVRAARRWYRQQVISSIWPALRRRFDRLPNSPRPRPASGFALRLAWRGVRRRGWSAAMHVGLVAACVASCAVAFAAADAFVFNRAPFPNAARLVVFQRGSPVGLTDYLSSEERAFWQPRSDLFSGLYAHAMRPPSVVDDHGMLRSIATEDVEVGLFAALGTAPRLGRSFVEDDERPGSSPVAIVAEPLARVLFGSPAEALGKTMGAGSDKAIVIGVMPDGFHFPTSQAAIWRPLQGADGANRSFATVAVLAAGVTFTRVAAEVAARVAALDGAAPAGGRPTHDAPMAAVLIGNAQPDPRAWTNAGSFTSASAPVLFMSVLAAAIALALVACLNIASLELTSALDRSRVFAIHAALGAGRASLLRMTLLEDALLTGVGTAAGLGAAVWGTALLQAALPRPLAAVQLNAIDLDLRAAAVAAAVAGFAWLLGSAPLVRHALTADAASLGGITRGATMSRRHLRLRHTIVGFQVAVTVVLLVAATLFAWSYSARAHRPTGLDPNVLSVTLAPPPGSPVSPERSASFLAAVRAMPDIAAAAPASGILPPSTRAGTDTYLWLDAADVPAARVLLGFSREGPDFLPTLGAQVLAGRGVDAAAPESSVVVEDTFARRYWPDGRAIGARFTTGTIDTPARDRTRTIVGVVSDIRWQMATPPGVEFFMLHTAGARAGAATSFVVRPVAGRGDPALARRLQVLAPDLGATSATLASRYAEADADARIAAAATTSLGGLGVVVAAFGIYGVLSCVLVSRRREIGIRAALGAGRAEIRAALVRSLATAIAAGVAIGEAIAMLLARLVDAPFADVAWARPAAYVVAALIVLATGGLASMRPLSQAVRVDPATSLRTE